MGEGIFALTLTLSQGERGLLSAPLLVTNIDGQPFDKLRTGMDRIDIMFFVYTLDTGGCTCCQEGVLH